MKLHEAIDLVLMSPTRVALYSLDKKQMFMYDRNYTYVTFDGISLGKKEAFRLLVKDSDRLFVHAKWSILKFPFSDILSDEWAVVLCDLSDLEETSQGSDSTHAHLEANDVESLGRVLTYYSPEVVLRHHTAKGRERGMK